jgi:hypothetical protein
MRVRESCRVRRTVATTLLIAATCVGGCGGNRADHGAGSSPDSSRAQISVTSAQFAAGGQLPDRYTCHGAGLSPPLRWSSLPAGTAAVAVIVADPDAPRGPYTHWVVFDLPPQVRELASATIPPQARQGRNSAGSIGYTPPCPPSGTHHYHFTVVGLRDRIELPDGAPQDLAIQQIWAEAVARGTLVATVTHR